MTKARLKANGMLLLTAVLWGGCFVAQRVGMQSLGPFTFNGLRFALGTITLLPIFIWRRRRHQREAVEFKRTVQIGAAAGLLLFFGATFQQLGLVYTTAGKAGFVTGLYVIIVPLLGMIWGDRAPLQSWAGAVLAVVGLYFLSGKGQGTIALGDVFVLVGAFFWAGHVQFIAHFSTRVRPLRLSCVQSLVTALLSFLVGMLWEEPTWRMVMDAAGPILYGGVISIGFAYTLQIVAQQEAKPTPAAIILSLESVFAVFWGWLFLGEKLSTRGVLGAGLMLSGMILAQIRWSREGQDLGWELHP
jgi:drug/metabolite transporter (DMT)-like permease